MGAVRFSVAVCFWLLSCDSGVDSKPVVLDTSSHSRKDLSWGDAPIKADTRWRFLSSRPTGSGIEVTGAWEISLRNTSRRGWWAKVDRLAFEDSEGFQVAAYMPPNESLIYRRLRPQETVDLQGNFQIDVASIELANDISHMGVWAAFWED